MGSGTLSLSLSLPPLFGDGLMDRGSIKVSIIELPFAVAGIVAGVVVAGGAQEVV